MDDAYFLPTDESSAGGTYLADPSTGGPWDPLLQHGGPPNALLVRTAERLAAAESPGAPLIACRLAAEFIGPVPVGEVGTAARIVRAARSGVLVDVTLSSSGRECLHGRVWLVRDTDTASVAQAARAGQLPPSARPPSFGMSFPYADSIDWHEVDGSITVAGPGTVWARPRRRLVPGEELTGLQRAALIGDSASGISAELDWATWSFLNVDLDVHLARPFVSSWLHMAAATQLGPNGAALTRSTISDEHGPVGATAQTLILAARRR